MKKKVLWIVGIMLVGTLFASNTRINEVPVNAEVIANQTKRVHFFGNTDASVWGASGETMKINYVTDSTPTTSNMILDLSSAGSKTTTYSWYFDLPGDVASYTYSHYDASETLIGTSDSIIYSSTSIMHMVRSDGVPIAKTDKPSAFLHPSPDTMRVWVTGYNSSWYGSQGYPLTVRVDGSTHYYLNYFNIDGGRTNAYYYADIPVDSSWQLFSLNVPSSLDTKASTYPVSSEHYKLYKPVTASSSVSVAINAVAIDDPALDNNVHLDAFTKILEGYTTCSDSTINGYGAWDNLNTYWFNNLESSDLTGLNLLDHDQTDIEAGVYKDNVYKTTTVSVQDKWDMMETLYGSIPSAPDVAVININNKDDLSLILFASAFISLAVLSTIYTYFRRKRTI